MKPAALLHRSRRSGRGRFAALWFLAGGLALSAGPAAATPLRALLITGGCCHDYEQQKRLLTAGISARANVTWDIVHEGGESRDHRVSLYERPGWSRGYDVVVHNECFGQVMDREFVDGLAREHAAGVPAVVLHCTMHSYRASGSEEWRKFLGVTSVRHERHRPLAVKNLQPEHPVMRGFPAVWNTPNGELYIIDHVQPTAVPLAQAHGEDTGKDHVTVWVNTYGQTRVFGTTLGHHNETVAHPQYLDLVTRGLLWATDKLAADGTPQPGYGPGGDGWISLFDGKTLAGWTAAEHPGSFQVRDGMIVVDGPRAHLFYTGPVANAEFTDFEFKAEVRTMPQANSGIYFHTRFQESGWPAAGYEAQVNATHGDRRKTGSLYAVQDVMDQAPHRDEEWFDYHIIVAGKRVTHKINGATVMEFTESDDATGRRRLSGGTFALQAHDPGSRINYRNLRVKLPAGDASQTGFVPLFNGENLDGWEGDPRFWRVENGAIVAETTPDRRAPHNTFLIWRQGEVDDFELKLNYRIDSPQANSGIQFRSEDLGDFRVRGYQADIATEYWITGAFYEERGRGMLARRGQKVAVGDGPDSVTVLEQFGDAGELLRHIRRDDWNEYHLIVRGHQVIQKINGHRMSEGIDRGQRDARLSGILALQLHSGTPMKIQFKDLALRRLPLAEGRKKVVLVAGPRSHGFGAHEHRAGNLLFQRLLAASVPQLHTTLYHNGWPQDPTAFDNADALLIYANGGGGHPVLPHLETVDRLMKRGVGLLCLHYAVEVPKGDPGAYFLDWIGGYFETHWSVNPHWTLEQTRLAPDHPVTRGVKPYAIYDEWYYHMRFREHMAGVTALLSAVPPANSLARPDGPHSGNPHVRAQLGQPQHLVWARERPDGGRGFGFTGGHDHWNWGHPDQRTLVLNAMLWAARLEVPAGGVPSPRLTLEDLLVNQDYPEPDNFDHDRIRGWLNEWQSAAPATP